MDYTTVFDGHISITPPLNAQERAYLEKFNQTRRMWRSNGPYFVGGSGFMGQGHDPDVLDFSRPAGGQPGLWCQWVPNATGDGLIWDQGEKFYYAAEWMQYLIDHFLGSTPIVAILYPELKAIFTGHTLSGCIFAQGEDQDDQWSLTVRDDQVFVHDESGSRAVKRSAMPTAAPQELPPARVDCPLSPAARAPKQQQRGFRCNACCWGRWPCSRRPLTLTIRWR